VAAALLDLVQQRVPQRPGQVIRDLVEELGVVGLERAGRLRREVEHADRLVPHRQRQAQHRAHAVVVELASGGVLGLGVERVDQQGGPALLDDPVEGQRFQRGDPPVGEGAVGAIALQVLHGGLRPLLQDDARLLEADDLLQVVDRHRENVVEFQVLGDLQGDPVGDGLPGQLVAQAVFIARAPDGDRQPGGQHVQRLERFRRHARAVGRVACQKPAEPVRPAAQGDDQQVVRLPGHRAGRVQAVQIVRGDVLDEDGEPARGPVIELGSQGRGERDRAGAWRGQVRREIVRQGERHRLPAQAAHVLHGMSQQRVQIVLRGTFWHPIAPGPDPCV